jgi:hypothetical protein
MSCSIVDDRQSSRRGGPINDRSCKTMNDLEHAHTGTHAVGTAESIRNLFIPRCDEFTVSVTTGAREARLGRKTARARARGATRVPWHSSFERRVGDGIRGTRSESHEGPPAALRETLDSAHRRLLAQARRR